MHAKKIVQLVVLVLAIALLLCSSAVAAPTTSDTSFAVTQAHEFKVVPGSAEWNTYYSPEQKLSASYVSPDELRKMTTEALVETVLSYPLLVDMFAFDNLKVGIEKVSLHFAGIDELRTRSDAIMVLSNYKATSEPRGTVKGFRELCAATLAGYLAEVSTDTSSESAVSPMGIASHVHTPVGTVVLTTYLQTWSDLGITYDQAYLQSQQMDITYPSTVWLYNPSAAYNCHSFAWYSASSSNLHWMNDPSAYMYDGSYYPVALASAPVGAKVWYGSGGHSAIVTATGFRPMVKSKWGCLAAFYHYYNDCPYYVAACTFWRR